MKPKTKKKKLIKKGGSKKCYISNNHSTRCYTKNITEKMMIQEQGHEDGTNDRKELCNDIFEDGWISVALSCKQQQLQKNNLIPICEIS